MTREDKIKKIARHYGDEAQSRQCIEEMAELTQAINKYWRKDLECGKYPYNPYDGYMPDDSKEYKNILEEIADVQIMLQQMKFFLDPLNIEHIDEIVELKIDRQLRRMEEENAD